MCVNPNLLAAAHHQAGEDQCLTHRCDAARPPVRVSRSAHVGEDARVRGYEEVPPGITVPPRCCFVVQEPFALVTRQPKLVRATLPRTPRGDGAKEALRKVIRPYQTVMRVTSGSAIEALGSPAPNEAGPPRTR